jgi:hypothetical protein
MREMRNSSEILLSSVSEIRAQTPLVSFLIHYYFTILSFPIGAGRAQSVQGRAMGWIFGGRFSAGVIFFSSLQHPDWLWGPTSLLSNGYLLLFPWR